MNPTKALKALTAPTCEPCDGPQDFHVTAKMSIYTCILTKTCPICGSKGGRSEGQTRSGPVSFFHCDRHSGHLFEVDDDAASADRVRL